MIVLMLLHHLNLSFNSDIEAIYLEFISKIFIFLKNNFPSEALNKVSIRVELIVIFENIGWLFRLNGSKLEFLGAQLGFNYALC